ncbi:MAG: DUF4942 domain-containing protein [Syntrophobacteraceae bacterium]
MFGSTDVIPRSSVIAMIAEVQAAQREVEQAFELLSSAKERLHGALGGYHDHLWEERISDYNPVDEAKSSVALIERNAWKSVVTRLQVRDIISVKKREELDNQLNKGTLPPLTEANVFAFMEQLFNDMGSLLDDSAREVFDWLRPTNNWKQLKTNNKNVFGLTSKVIVEWGMDSNWNRMPRRVSYYKEKYFKALDNVFHLLDGRGVAKHPEDMCTLIHEAAEKGMTQCSTPYFHLKWFKNLNLHIEFRRMDLVKELNKLAGSDKVAA